MKKTNSLFFLIFFIYTIISSRTIASNKNINDNLNFIDQIKFYDKELITKYNTKIWIKEINSHLKKYKRKIKIGEDYLNLITIFPSNKNIKSYDINQELIKNKKIMNGHIKKINDLRNLYKFVSSEKNPNTYLVIYNLKILNNEKSYYENIKWFTLCSLNSSYDEKMIILRKKLLYVFHYLGYEGFPMYKNQIRNSNYLTISDSQLDQKVCNEFKKKKWIYL